MNDRISPRNVQTISLANDHSGGDNALTHLIAVQQIVLPDDAIMRVRNCLRIWLEKAVSEEKDHGTIDIRDEVETIVELADTDMRTLTLTQTEV